MNTVTGNFDGGATVIYAPYVTMQERCDRLEHAANEWADMAVNGLQWLRNIQDGISDPTAAIENLVPQLLHCQKTSKAAAIRAIDKEA